MGHTDTPPPPDFTPTDIANRELVLRLLRYEDALYMSPAGQAILARPDFSNIFSLDAGKRIQRDTLIANGFSSTDASLATYRTIFQHYWRSASDYDAEVLAAVFYMRENRCLYYTAPDLVIGDTVPDCPLLELDGTPTSVHAVCGSKPTMLAAFSLS